VTDRIRQIRAHGTVSPGVASALSRATNGRLDVEMRDQQGAKCWWAPDLRIVAVERESGTNRLTLVLELDPTRAVDPRAGRLASPPRPLDPPTERNALVARGNGGPVSGGEKDAQRDTILRLSQDGIRPREIARRLGLSPQQVGSLVARQRSAEDRRLRDEEIRRLAADGWTQAEIAERVGGSEAVVRRVVGAGRERR